MMGISFLCRKSYSVCGGGAGSLHYTDEETESEQGDMACKWQFVEGQSSRVPSSPGRAGLAEWLLVGTDHKDETWAFPKPQPVSRGSTSTSSL